MRKSSLYSSRIIKASALIADTKVLLSEWDQDVSVADNLARAHRQNIFGKASRKRIEDILVIFRQRFFSDPDIGQMLVALVQEGAPDAWLDPLLYFFAAQNDRTLRDMVIEVIYPRQQAGYTDLPIETVVNALRQWMTKGKTTTPWGEETIQRVAQGITATLRDFGVLQGTQRKQITPFYLPTPAFALAAYWLKEREPSGDRMLHSNDWRLFFLPVAAVERFFIEAHQEHLLTYQAAGSVVRIDFPVNTLTEYAHVIIGCTR